LSGDDEQEEDRKDRVAADAIETAGCCALEAAASVTVLAGLIVLPYYFLS
jgi:hypothetical protein